MLEIRSYTLKDHIKGNVTFLHYRKGNLYYQAVTGLTFPVPTDDIGDATFFASDKAILFMRYIKKQLKAIESEEFKGQKV